MADIKILVKRCEEIIKEGDEVVVLQHAQKLIYKVNTSIENIYNLCYPNGVPSYLKLSNLKDTLIDQGISPQFLSEVGLFKLRFNSFKAFVEDLKKGLITSDLISLLSIDIFNDLITQAEDLRKFNTEPLNRAACVLSRIVLEEGLRKMCFKYGITLTSNKANEANIELKKNLIYGTTQFKHADTWLSIGNTAAHPQSPKLGFASITNTQMDDMIKNIPEFLHKYL